MSGLRQENWEASDSNLKKYESHPQKTAAEWPHTAVANTADGQPNALKTGATSVAKHLCGDRESKNCMFSAATPDLGHILMNCEHFGERPSNE